MPDQLIASDSDTENGFTLNDRDSSPTMIDDAETATFRQYRAPQRHGDAFIQPGLERVSDVLDQNISLIGSHGGMLESLRTPARRQLIRDAVRYTSAYRDVESIGSDEPSSIIMAGHQPAIFHPGVWFKNYALSHLAAQAGAMAINLVIDNDVSSGSGIRVPTITSDSTAAYQVVRYDDFGGGVPYEQTTITDREMFDTFDKRVRSAMAPLVEDPCVDQLWQHARRAIERCGVAGCALAQARHGLEGDMGLQTLELPLGVVCRTPQFAEFALAILSELPRFHQCYNDAADFYRAAHGIRSKAHPVPNLSEDQGWFEAPMWIYGDDAPTRKAAWARLSDDHLVISDRGSRQLKIDLRFPKLAAEQLAGHASPNFKLRPRALLTTMYARLILSDLFLHGIGGGKYDQLGDMIMQSFFMVRPPQFMVVSATVQLPGLESPPDEDRIAQLKRQIRDTRFRGERFADQIGIDPALLEQKRQLLAAIPPKGNRSEWHGQIDQINQTMSRQLRDLRASMRSELASLEKQAASQRLLAGREHPFCVFPLDYLTRTYQQILTRYRT